MTIDYASAGDLLEKYGRAWATFDGDLFVSLFTEQAGYHGDPFEPPLVGHNALRRYWLDAAETQDQVEFTVERHWVSGDTILAACHASYVERPSGDRIRLKAFLTLEIEDGRVVRFREWRNARRAHVGTPETTTTEGNHGR
jgi:ketosteroid isomerase-like protein